MFGRLFGRRSPDGAGSLAGERKAGTLDAGGSGMSDADLYPPDAGVHYDLVGSRPEAVFGPGFVAGGEYVGLPRPQRAGVTQYTADEYREAPAMGGLHSEIVNRPFVLGAPGVVMLPDYGTPETIYRDVPPTDANNPLPGGC